MNERGTFALHLLPSGIFRDGVVNVLGNGVAVDPQSLVEEIDYVTQRGVTVTPENLKISDRASLVLPWHRDLDELEELRRQNQSVKSLQDEVVNLMRDLRTIREEYALLEKRNRSPLTLS